jgi:hypothetical protein
MRPLQKQPEISIDHGRCGQKHVPQIISLLLQKGRKHRFISRRYENYILTLIQANLIQASDVCCSKNMSLLSLETRDEFNCITSLQYGELL